MLKRIELHPEKDISDYDRGMGMLTLLGATSSFGSLPLNQAAAVLHGGLLTGSFRIYAGSNGRPSAAVIWAFLNDQTATAYQTKGILRNLSDWNSGDQLWFLHIIAEGGKIRSIIRDFINDPEFAHIDYGYMLRATEAGHRRVVKIKRDGMQLARLLPS